MPRSSGTAVVSKREPRTGGPAIQRPRTDLPVHVDCGELPGYSQPEAARLRRDGSLGEHLAQQRLSRHRAGAARARAVHDPVGVDFDQLLRCEVRSSPHLVHAAKMADIAKPTPRTAVLSAHGFNTLRRPVAIAFPLRTQVAFKTALLYRRESPPDRFHFGPQRIYHRSPIETAFRGPRLRARENCAKGSARREYRARE